MVFVIQAVVPDCVICVLLLSITRFLLPRLKTMTTNLINKSDLKETGFPYMNGIYRQAVHDSNLQHDYIQSPPFCATLFNVSYTPYGPPTSVT